MSEPVLGFAQLRAAIPASAYERSYAWALALALQVLGLYCALTWLTYTASSPAWLVVFAVARGLSIGPVFIVGHDACHNSLSPSSRLNYWLGCICLLPSWHSFTAWKVRHNHAHHRHTNIIELDPGYPPASPDQYAGWPWWRRLIYRLARTPAGAGLLYFPEVLKAQLLPAAALRRQYRNVDCRHSREWLLAWAWLAGELALFSGLLAHLGWAQPSPQSGSALLGAFGLTHLVWNWQMGFTTFLHHFHPDVAWHSEAMAPDAAQRQLECTVHADLGRVPHFAMLNILVHTAHHVDTAIPLYRLPAAQRALELHYIHHVLRWNFGLATALRCFRECKLWDPAQRRWLRFRPAPAPSCEHG